MKSTKSFAITKRMVYEAWKRVKAKRGAAGIDEQSVAQFEEHLSGNLYKLWNRMASGSYFPPPVREVHIPKRSGGVRTLGVPTVADRIAQAVVRAYLEPLLELHFDRDSYGFRPGRSPKQAVQVVRERCWKFNWVLEFDIKRAFDNLDHDLLMKAVRKHTECRWVVLYIDRWLKAPSMGRNGELHARTRGTPQGGVISPLLMNLFMHYWAPGQTWYFQRVKFPPRQEVEPPHRESSLGSEEATNRTKRRQSDARAVTKSEAIEPR